MDRSYDSKFVVLPETVIVTGVASGMGRAAAEILASNGVRNMGLIDNNAEGLAQTAGAVEAKGVKVHAIALSVADRLAVHAAFEALAAKFGAPDSLLHFAGISSRVPFDEIDDENADTVLGVNLKGSMWVAQAALRHMRKASKAGSIVFTGSVSARRGPVHGNVAYASSKGGVNTLTRTLARQYGPYNIRVNAVSPGQIYTPLLSKGWGDDADVIKEKLRVREEVARTEVVLGRIGQAHEVARAAIFLASEASSYITGEILEVNGGFHFD